MELTDLTRAFESGDFARPNLFEVEIPYLGKNFSFKCKAAAMPPANVDKIAVGYMNRKLNVAGDRTFDDWNCTIYSDDKHETRQALSTGGGRHHPARRLRSGQRQAGSDRRRSRHLSV